VITSPQPITAGSGDLGLHRRWTRWLRHLYSSPITYGDWRGDYITPTDERSV